LFSIVSDELQRQVRVAGSIPHGDPKRRPAECTMYQFCLDISHGLAHIHDKGYTHRDLKMENILVRNWF